MSLRICVVILGLLSKLEMQELRDQNELSLGLLRCVGWVALVSYVLPWCTTAKATEEEWQQGK